MIKNVHGNTLDFLGEAILKGQYPVGSTLPPEPVLGEALGVSRTVIREAVKSLIAKGLVSTGPKVGTRVLPAEQWNWFDQHVIAWQARVGLTPEFLRNLQELRRVVEPASVRLAALRATDLDIAEIEAAYAGMALAVKKGGDYVSHDLQFHMSLLKACRNPLLIQMGKALSALLRTSFELSTARKGGTAASLPLHRAVLDAVIAHKPLKAEKAILALIDGASQDIDQVLVSRKRLPRLSKPAPALKAS